MRHVRFRRVGWFRKGYQCSQVDRFLSRVDLAARPEVGAFSSAEIRKAGFELVRRGYVTRDVDIALDQLEERAMAATSSAGRRGKVDLASESDFLRRELGAPYMRRFGRARALRRGYEIDDVDEFLDRVAAAIEGEGSLTVEEVRSAVFRPKRGGV